MIEVIRYEIRNYSLCYEDEVLDYVERLAKTVTHDWGFNFLKIDFLYASAVLDAKYHDPTFTRAQMIRRGVQAVRNGLGDDRVLLGCGAPLGPCVGLVNVMRIGIDTAAAWAPMEKLIKTITKLELPALKPALRATIQRTYMHNTWWINDPDCVVVRENKSKLTLDEVLLQLTVFGISGGQVLISDDEPLVSSGRMDLLKKILPPYSPAPGKNTPTIAAYPLDLFEVATPTLYAKNIQTPFGGRHAVAIINWENKSKSRTLCIADLLPYSARLAYPEGQTFIIFDFWKESIISRHTLNGTLTTSPIAAHGCSYWGLIPVPIDDPNALVFIGSTLHITQGAAEIASIEQKKKILQINLNLPGEHNGDLYFLLPEGKILDSETNAIQILETTAGSVAKVHVFLKHTQELILTIKKK